MGEKGGLFRFADSVDKLLMFVGILGSIGEGLASPLTMYVTSGAIDAFGASDQSIAKKVVDEVWIWMRCLFFTCINFFQKFIINIRFNFLHMNCVNEFINFQKAENALCVFVQYGLRLFYVAVGVGFACFFGMF